MPIDNDPLGLLSNLSRQQRVAQSIAIKQAQAPRYDNQGNIVENEQQRRYEYDQAGQLERVYEGDTIVWEKP